MTGRCVVRLATLWVPATLILLASVFGAASAFGSDAAPSRSVRDRSTAGPELTRVHLDGPAWSIAYDGVRNAIWYGMFSIGGPSSLCRFDIGASSTRCYGLPNADDNGFLAETELAPDGSVWVTEPYRLVRFDPASGSTSSRDFPVTASGTGVSDPDAGTWLSAIAFDGVSDAVFVRNNTSSVLEVSPTMTEVATIPLPDAYAGPRSIAVAEGRVLVAPPVGRDDLPLIQLDNNGHVLARGPAGAARLLERNGRVLVSGAGSPGWIGTDATLSRLSAPTMGYSDRAAIAPDGGVVLYMHGSRTLMRLSATGEVISRLQLPVRQESITNAAGKQVQVKVGPWTTAIAVDAAGIVWYVDLSTDDLVSVSL